MSDAQLRNRLVIRRLLIAAFLLVVASCGCVYYCWNTQATVDNYKLQIAREAGLQSQISNLEMTNSSLRSAIDKTGKELVSFSEDKIKYINLASEMSEEFGVKINKLSVSDIWEEGQMSCMTTSLEIEGDLDSVTKFINSYCGINYTNRINVVSCRPSGRYPWLTRAIDGKKVLDWFNLESENALYNEFTREEEARISRAAMEAGIILSSDDLITSVSSYTNPSITLSEMFSNKIFKVYLEIDFLGRQ